MRAIAAFIISLLAVACSDSTTIGYGQQSEGRISIAHLKTMAVGSSVEIVENVAIEGYVVVNDLYGEYYKTIVISDESGGIELMIDCDNTAVEFPVSARVTVHCTGLSVGVYGGRVMLGAVPERDFTVDRLSMQEAARHIKVDKSTPTEIRAKEKKISEISTADVSNYVVINDVEFVDQGLAWCDKDPLTEEYITTTRTVSDSEGRRIGIRTIASCSYRAERLPEGRGRLYGVVEYFNGEFALRVVNHGVVFNK